MDGQKSAVASLTKQTKMVAPTNFSIVFLTILQLLCILFISAWVWQAEMSQATSDLYTIKLYIISA